MNTPYDERMAAARQRLAAALNPQTEAEHTWCGWLISNMMPAEADVFSNMVERRTRTAVRAARMELADHVLSSRNWSSGSVAEVDRLMHIASGGEDEDAIAEFDSNRRVNNTDFEQLRRDQERGQKRRKGESS